MGTSQSRNRLIGGTDLIRAASKGKTAKVRRLLAQPDIDVNAQNKEGNTALIEAAFKGHAEIVKMLLAAGANLEAKNNYGGTALVIAAEAGNARIVELLLDAGADLDEDGGYNALTGAVQNGHTDVVKLLLAQPRIDVNAKDDKGNTALMSAAGGVGDAEIVELLLAVPGIDVDAKNNSGKDALSVAAGWGRVEIVEQLLAQEPTARKRRRGRKRGRELHWVSSDPKRQKYDIIDAVADAMDL